FEHGRKVAALAERGAEAVRRTFQRNRLGERDSDRRDLEKPHRRLQAPVVISALADARNAIRRVPIKVRRSAHAVDSIMIDQVGFSVSDYARAKAFYERALAPLGYTLIMEATAQETGQPAAGFGSGGKPDFWIGGEGKLEKPVHIAITAKDR